MKDTDLYAQILGIRLPWKMAEVKLALAVGKISVFVEHDPTVALNCPKCGCVTRLRQMAAQMAAP